MSVDTKENDKINKTEEKIEKKTPKEELVETKHSISINGTKIDYTVKTGTLIIKHESDTKDEAKEPIPKASIFY